MIEAGALRILILILIVGGIESVIVVNNHPDEEYFLEHEVLYEDAIAAAKKLEIYPGPSPGCKACTNSEMTYCQNGSVINDHCCCEGSSNKVFLFVQHTCRVGPQECKVQAGDCAEYTRLRQCCCHSYLATVWKNWASSAELRIHGNLTKFLAISMVLRFLFYS